MQGILEIWEETSHQLNKLQTREKEALAEKKNIYDMQTLPYSVSFTPEDTSKSVLDSKAKIKVAIVREEGSNGDREMTSAFYAAGFEPWDVTMSDLMSGTTTLEDFRGVVFVGGFSYADVLGSAKGWASTIRFNESLKKMFDDFYNRKDTFSLGVCNGCQLMGLLGLVPYRGIEDDKQPRFVQNTSGRFESRWANVKINKSPSIMLDGMEGSTLGIWVAHGEGNLACTDETIMKEIVQKGLAPISYVDDKGEATEKYPFNPNGSPGGITALCSEDGRHLAMMPHPERAFLKWQWPWWPEGMEDELAASPWLQMFQNARKWCEEGN
jgi:phosphoribosylformylglycinamidine synthase